MKTNRLYLIAAAGLIIGIFLMFAGFGMLGFHFDQLFSVSKFEEKEYTVSNDIDKIVIKDFDTDVELIRSNDDEMHINYYDSNREIYEITEQKNGTLDIRIKNISEWFDHIMVIELESPNLVIEVPENYQGDFNIELSAGNISMDEISAKNLKIKAFDGKITMEEVTAEDSIYVKSVAGGIQLEDVEYGTKMECIARDSSLKGTLNGSASEYNIECKVMDGESNLLVGNTQGTKSLIVDVIAGNAMLDFNN